MPCRFVTVLLLALWSTGAAASDVGVVLVHGKWSTPKVMLGLERALVERGYAVANPEWAWSGTRLYDVDYPAALKEMEGRVVELRGRGARRIVVAGQSLGANAAVAYAFSGREVDALALLSPGHFPEGATGKRLRASIDRAKRLVEAGRGAERASFEDSNQGKVRVLTVVASHYLSYFDPAGLAAATVNVRKLSRPLPVLVAVAANDGFYPQSRAFFESAPAHPQSRYLTLDSDHFDLRNAVAKDFLEWLERLRSSWGP